MPAPLAIAGVLAQLIGPWAVGKLAGDKAGRVAREVIDHAVAVTGADSPEAALRSLQSDPQLLVAYRSRVMEHAEKIEAMEYADRASARERDQHLIAAGYTNKRADAMILTAFASLVVIIVLVWHARASMPAEVFGMFNTAIGYLLKMLGDAFAFEFGSSRGSKDKDAAIARGRE